MPDWMLTRKQGAYPNRIQMHIRMLQKSRTICGMLDRYLCSSFFQPVYYLLESPELAGRVRRRSRICGMGVNALHIDIRQIRQFFYDLHRFLFIQSEPSQPGLNFKVDLDISSGFRPSLAQPV